MTLSLEQEPKGPYEGPKRFYAAYTVKGDCPRCGAHPLADRYLSYPTIGGSTKVELHCEDNCGGLLVGHVVIDIVLRLEGEVTGLKPVVSEPEGT